MIDYDKLYEEDRAQVGKVHLYTGGTKCGGLFCKIFCQLNLHRWNYPGGWCECCGELDEFGMNIVREKFKQ